MILGRFVAGAAVVACGLAAMPASAQFFLQSPSMAGERVNGDEPGVIQPMPGATPAELRANLVWSMRAALNVAALQCQFEPTLLSDSQYNAILKDHFAELKTSYDALTKYYVRTTKTKAAAQTALDQYGTRTYASFGTVAGQYGFCQTAHQVGRDALFVKRGEFGEFAATRLREMRNSLVPFGEQRFPSGVGYAVGRAPLPRMEAQCWNKKGEWQARKCGEFAFPAGAGPAVATR